MCFRKIALLIIMYHACCLATTVLELSSPKRVLAELAEEEKVFVNRACVQRSLSSVFSSCDTVDGTLGEDDPSGLRVALSAMLHACVTFNDSSTTVRRLRVLAGLARLYPELHKLGSKFSEASGIPLYFNVTTRLGAFGPIARTAIARPPPIVDTADVSGGADAFILSPSYMWSMAQGGKLLDLGPLVSEDLQLKWYQVKRVLREQMVVYGNKIVAIPLTTAPVFLFYHAPTFERDGLQVPLTWDQVLALAEEYNGKDINGDGEPDYGFCMTPSGCFVDGTMLQWIMASFVQTHGSSHGVLLDPLTLANLANSTAMVEALEVMRRLRMAGPSSGSCAAFEDSIYLQGRCLMSMTSPVTWKAAYSPDAPSVYAGMRGRMGMASFPGSTRVLDRTTGQMVPCNATRCPLATASTLDKAGVLLPVNQPVPSTNVIVMINAQSEPKYQFYAYSLFSYLSSPRVLGTSGASLLLDPRLESAPLRDPDLHPDAAAEWVKYGYHQNDVDVFFNAYRAAMDNPNQLFESKFPGNINISASMTIAALLYTNTTPGYVRPPAFVPVSIIARALSAVIAEQGGPDTFANIYRQTLNWQPPPTSFDATDVSDASSSGRQERTTAIAVAVPCGVALLAVALLAGRLVWRRRQAGRDARAAVVAKAPGAGPDTTLLVTDIQSSTSLWEHLDAAVMDRALFLHHMLLRSAIAEWRGYESATEGDSFIVAFTNPTDALMCALAAQQSLLEAPWPPELLSYPPLPGLEGELDPLMPVAAALVAAKQPPGAPKGHPKPRSPLLAPISQARQLSGLAHKRSWHSKVSGNSSKWSPFSMSSVQPAPGPGAGWAGSTGSRSRIGFDSFSAGGAVQTTTVSVADGVGDTAAIAQQSPLPSHGQGASTQAAMAACSAGEGDCGGAADAAKAISGGEPSFPGCHTERPSPAELRCEHGSAAPNTARDAGWPWSPQPVSTSPASGAAMSYPEGPMSAEEATPKPPLASEEMGRRMPISALVSNVILNPLAGLPDAVDVTDTTAGFMSAPSAVTSSRALQVMALKSQLQQISETQAGEHTLSPCEATCAGEHGSEAGSGVGTDPRVTMTSMSTSVDPTDQQTTLTLSASILASIQIIYGITRTLSEDTAPQVGAVGPKSTASPVTVGAGWSPQVPTSQPPAGRLPSYVSQAGAGAPPAAATGFPAGTIPLFCGLRVRMGMWTGVPNESDVSLNAVNRRTQYSGECIVMAKAVSDTVHGGMVVLPECSRQRLDADVVRAARHVVLYSGLHVVTSKEEGKDAPQLHLYTCYSQSLLPRAMVVRPVKSVQELRPGILAAPVGHGTVVKMQVVGVDTLLAWDKPATCAALELLHSAAIQLLPFNTHGGIYIARGSVTIAPQAVPEPSGPFRNRTLSGAIGSPGEGGGGGGGMAAPGAMAVIFTDADAAVGWAAAVRRALNTLDWPPALLEHELAEEVWVAAPDNAGFGNAYQPPVAIGLPAEASAAPSARRQSLALVYAAAVAQASASAGSTGSVHSGRLTSVQSAQQGPLRRSRFSGGLTSPAALACQLLRGSLGFTSGLGQSPGSRTGGGGAGSEGGEEATVFQRQTVTSYAANSDDGDEDRTSIGHPWFGSNGPILAPAQIASDQREDEAAQRQKEAAAAAGTPKTTTTGPETGASNAGAVLTKPPVIEATGGRDGMVPQVARRPDSCGVAYELTQPREALSPSRRRSTALRSLPTPSHGEEGAEVTARDRLAGLQHTLKSCPAGSPTGSPIPSPAPSSLLVSPAPQHLLQNVLELARQPGSGSTAARESSGNMSAARSNALASGARQYPAEDRAGGGSGGAVSLRLLFRGLRLRWAVTCGPLKGTVVPGDVSGHLSYKGKAFTHAAKLLSKARAGQICVAAEFARTLPSYLMEELTVLDKP